MFRNNSFILLESHHLNDKKMEQTGRLFRYHLSANTLRGSDSIAFVQSHPPNILPCSRVGGLVAPDLQPRPQGFSLKKWVKSPGDEVDLIS